MKKMLPLFLAALLARARHLCGSKRDPILEIC